MIVSASRRTDIPAFFSDWFYNRISEGFVLVRNPMNIHRISRIDIRPEVVDCIVLWTKNPQRFMRRLSLINNYHYYFQYTITGYGQQLEPNVPSLENSIETFSYLSKLIGKNRVIWRYDPIIITDKQNVRYHANHFKSIAQKLSAYTDRCVISFVDLYKKTLKNMAHIKFADVSRSQIVELADYLSSIGQNCGITLVTCAEEIDLTKQGITHGSCIDDKLIEEISGFSLEVGKDKSQRSECGCVASIDIGAYNTCPHGCLYCYANYDQNRVRRNYAEHDSSSPLLFGRVTSEDSVSSREVISCRVLQRALFPMKTGISEGRRKKTQ